MSAESSENEPVQITQTAPPSRSRLWILIGTFFIAYFLAASIALQIHDSHVSSQRLSTQMLAQGYAQRIQERLQTALISTYVLASVVKQARGQVQNFDDVAAELITLFPSVSALQLAPDGVIRDIYPRDGNEAAIGHDLLGDKQRNREAVVAITTQQLTLAGPFNLVQGGIGAVGRLPIFLANDRNESHFWGFANVLIRIPNLIEAAGLTGLAKAGYRYELWRVNPDTEKRQVFAHSHEAPLTAPVDYVVTVYNGRWILSLEPEGGWMSTLDYLEIFGYSLIAALVITALQYFAIGLLQRENAQQLRQPD